MSETTTSIAQVKNTNKFKNEEWTEGNFIFKGPRKIVYGKSIKHGPFLFRYTELTEFWIGSFDDDLENGLWQQFSKDGILLTSKMYKRGLLDGKMIGYRYDGSLESETDFVDNLCHGIHTEYDSYGKTIKSQTIYVNGVKYEPKLVCQKRGSADAWVKELLTYQPPADKLEKFKETLQVEMSK